MATSSHLPAARRVAVAHLGPDPRDGGGMPAVLREVVSSPLGDTHDLQVIPTHRRISAIGRIWVFLRAVVRLVGFCLRGGPRIVHVHATVGAGMYRKAACVVVSHVLRRPVVLHLHTGAVELAAFVAALGPRRRAAFSWAFGHADRVLSVSTACARVAERSYGLGAIEVVPNPAPALVHRGSDRAPGREGAAHVLYVGGFANPVKGAEVLLRALPLLLEQVPDVRVTLAGPGEPPGALATHSGRVRWIGWLDQPAKAAALRDADVFVLPSTSEGLPMALLEAMAHGLTVVASAVGGVPDVVTDGVEGLLVEPGDATALADALAAVVGDPHRARAMGRAAQDRAGDLGLDAFAARLEQVYRQLVDPAGTAVGQTRPMGDVVVHGRAPSGTARAARSQEAQTSGGTAVEDDR